ATRTRRSATPRDGQTELCTGLRSDTRSRPCPGASTETSRRPSAQPPTAGACRANAIGPRPCLRRCVRGSPSEGQEYARDGCSVTVVTAKGACDPVRSLDDLRGRACDALLNAYRAIKERGETTALVYDGNGQQLYDEEYREPRSQRHASARS